MPYDHDVLADLDADLDALEDPTTEQVYDTTLPFEASMVAATAAKRAMAGGGGGGSSAFDYVQAADPGAVGAGKTWLQLSTIASVDPWQADTEYAALSAVHPTTPNGFIYTTNDGLTSGDTEPDWSTNPDDSTPDGDGDWNAPQTPLAGAQGWIRNAADDGWNSISLLLDTDGNIRGRVWFNSDDNNVRVDFLTDDTGTIGSRLILGSALVQLEGFDDEGLIGKLILTRAQNTLDSATGNNLIQGPLLIDLAGPTASTAMVVLGGPDAPTTGEGVDPTFYAGFDTGLQALFVQGPESPDSGDTTLWIWNGPGATDWVHVASDGGVWIPPTVDPAIAGALWNDAGTPSISAG